MSAKRRRGRPTTIELPLALYARRRAATVTIFQLIKQTLAAAQVAANQFAILLATNASIVAVQQVCDAHLLAATASERASELAFKQNHSIYLSATCC